MSAFLPGFSLGLSLIVAIGAQNAFVLRQGIRNEHVMTVCLICAVSDAILISAGVAGFMTIISQLPFLDPAMRIIGASYLVVYGSRSLFSAWHSTEALVPAAGPPRLRRRTIATCLALTWLNPHVYLDTIVLIGSVATNFPGEEPYFAFGAMSASFIFFFSLGYGARLLRPVFANPHAWRYLELAIGVTMWAVAMTLLFST